MAARRQKKQGIDGESTVTSTTDISATLIRDLNVKFGSKVAYNLSEQTAPTIIKRWIHTGSVQLDYICRNMAKGGYPEGRIVEIAGLPSCGKSHLAYHACAVVQQMGGIAVYVDTETATPVDKLARMGIDVKNNFIYIDEHCTETVFSIIETTVLRARQLLKNNIDIPILIVWDSIAASSPKAELEGDYDASTMGLNARQLSKGFRKIVGVLSSNNITMICINQLRDKIGAMPHSDPLVTPGGKAVPFHASIRLRLSSGSPVKDKNGDIVGIHVIVTNKKNKVAVPFKKCEMDIMFGRGIVEHLYIFDRLREYCDARGGVSVKSPEGKDLAVLLTGTSGWKELSVVDLSVSTVVLSKKFHKEEFNQIMQDPLYKPYIDAVIEAAYVTNVDDPNGDVGDEPESDEGLNEGEETPSGVVSGEQEVDSE